MHHSGHTEDPARPQDRFKLAWPKRHGAANLPGVSTENPTPAQPEAWPVRLLLFLIPAALVLVSIRPYAGGWNDSSRLAAIESLGEHGSFIIDDSIFVRVPPELVERGLSPVDPAQPLLVEHGTMDKLFINGHFYSDKPPLVSVLLGGVYRLWLTAGGPRFAERPDVTIRMMTLLTSGLAYMVAIWCWYRLALLRGWSRPVRLLLVAGFALGTIAVPYVEQVNAHEMYLGVMSAVMLQLEQIRRALAERRPCLGRLLLLGTLGGLGYNLDPGLAPGIALALFGWVVWRVRHPVTVFWFVCSTLPWVASHHVLNHAIGGTWITPINANPEYFNFPNSPFNGTNITGFWRHTPLKFALYLPDLLFGKQGFFTHNLPMMLAVFCLPRMIWRRQLTGEQVAGLVFAGLGYLSYAILSKNHGGACCSVRWFVPFLAVGFVIIGDFLAWKPEYLREQIILTLGGLVLGASMSWAGPWTMRLVPGFWPIMGVTMLLFAISGFSRRPRQQ